MAFFYKASAIGLACVLGSAAYAADDTPCSQRYTHFVMYPITSHDVGKDPATVIAHWGIGPSHWGWDHVTIVNDEKPALRFFYPQGSINPNNPTAPRGGASFYINGGFIAPVKAACLKYSVYFPRDFAFAKGGKLPGLYGGRNEKGESAAGCRPGVEQSGFSTRYMWRENGAGSLYAYIPGKSTACGEYIGKGAWHFTPGAWTMLEQEVVLNDPGSSNGLVRVWVDGKLVIDQPKMVLRTKDSIGIDGVFFVSFFGGKEPEWASPKDQWAEFSAISAFFPR